MSRSRETWIERECACWKQVQEHTEINAEANLMPSFITPAAGQKAEHSRALPPAAAVNKLATGRIK